MKILCIFSALAISIIALKANAQTPVATLEHGGITTVFYGQSALSGAYNAAINGDTIMLSSGTFSDPPPIKKRLTIVGAGHYTDSVNNLPTQVLNIMLGSGSDYTHIEGIKADMIANNDTIRFITISRSFIRSIMFYYYSYSCTIESSVSLYILFGSVDVSNIIRNCIINCTHANGDALRDFNNGTLIENNILYHGGHNQFFYSVNNCLIRNNIIYNPNATDFVYNCFGNLIQKNFIDSPINASKFDTISNTVTNNYTGNIADIITGGLSAFNYNANYNITNPSLYIGTDNTQVGIYGGALPYKERAIPFNPHIESKYIQPKTDIDGNFLISIKVKAQNK